MFALPAAQKAPVIFAAPPTNSSVAGVGNRLPLLDANAFVFFGWALKGGNVAPRRCVTCRSWRKYLSSSGLIDMSVQHFLIYIQPERAPRTAHAFKSFAAAEVAIATNQRPGAYQS